MNKIQDIAQNIIDYFFDKGAFMGKADYNFVLKAQKDLISDIIKEVEKLRCSCGGNPDNCYDLDQIISILKKYE